MMVKSKIKREQIRLHFEKLQSSLCKESSEVEDVTMRKGKDQKNV